MQISQFDLAGLTEALNHSQIFLRKELVHDILFSAFSTLQDRMNRIFRESFSLGSSDEALTTSNVAPPVDVYEDERNITLKTEVPGIDVKGINVSIETNMLSVCGERRFEKDEKEENLPRYPTPWIQNL